MPSSAQERLFKARLALQAAQNRQGLRSFQARQMDSLKAGTYLLDSHPAQIIRRLVGIFAQPLWVAVLNVHNMGWEAAQKAGWDLTRTLVVKCTEGQGGSAISQLLENVDVLVVGDVSLRADAQRVLSAKARSMGRVVFTCSPWVTARALPSSFVLGREKAEGSGLRAG